MAKEKEKEVSESSFEGIKVGNTIDRTGGFDMDNEKQNFDSLVNAYGVDKAVARGVRTKMKVPADGSVKEADFVKALKEFTGQTPRG